MVGATEFVKVDLGLGAGLDDDVAGGIGKDAIAVGVRVNIGHELHCVFEL